MELLLPLLSSHFDRFSLVILPFGLSSGILQTSFVVHGYNVRVARIGRV